MKKPAKVTSIPDRIRGSIAIVLTLSCLTAGNYATDKQWQAGLVFAGVFYMMTALAYVFKDVDSFDQ
ncbi:MAG: hypothetical protein K2W82_11095 [Candidatus Obscuribacterales bacterium]|nr:hypothetical protein [Candidatus Obscuribacterales bacterium]